MYGGYGYGNQPMGYGMGGMGGGMGGPGYPGGIGPMGGMGMGLQGRYMFTRQAIDAQASMTFMKYDFNRNGLLGFNELRMAVNEFTALNGQPPVFEGDLMMIFQQFDYDGSGQIDFFEYKMLLEQLSGLAMYDRNMIMQHRAQRAMHLQQYRSFW